MPSVPTLTLRRIEHLLRRYGSQALNLLALVAESPEFGAPIIGAEQYLAVEAHYAAAYEGALHIDDILERRTRISIEVPDAGADAAATVAEVVGDVLGWDDHARRVEVDVYRRRVAAERIARQQVDDRAAEAAVSAVPGPRRLA